MNRWLKLLLLALAAVIGLQVLMPGPSTRLSAGGSAPALALDDLSGARIDLADLKGRVVLVNFWATWCPPCLAELPELAELWREQKPGCFELLGVAEQSPPGELARMSAAIPYPVLLDAKGAAAEAWSVLGFPSSFLVDTQGLVVKVFQGAVRKAQVTEAMRPHLSASCRGG